MMVMDVSDGRLRILLSDVGGKYFVASSKSIPLHHHHARIVTNSVLTTRNQKTAIATKVVTILWDCKISKYDV